MEASSDRDSQDRRVGPTVSKDKWANHAKQKMSRGYVLIVGTTRRTANFYSKEKGYEMCAYNIAKQLIKENIVVRSGSHHLGDVYVLNVVNAADAKARARHDDDLDEFDALLNQLDKETPTDQDDAPAESAF